MKKVRLRIKELREEFGYKQQFVASYLKIKQNTYSQYENKKREIPLELLVALAELYNTSTDYILGLID